LYYGGTALAVRKRRAQVDGSSIGEAMIFRVWQAGLVLGFFLAPSLLYGDQSGKSQTQDVMVAMTDGTELATTIYLPEGKPPFPVIVSRTPYNKDGLKGEAAKFNKNGYAFVAQDVRGRFKSKGHHSIIFHNDGWSKPRDGQDTLNWVAAQSWCNGKIGTTGGSALGICQNMTAPVAPDALQGQFVVVALSDMYSQGAYQGGAFRTGLLENWLKATGMVDVNLKTFVSHPKYDDFWAEMNPETQAERVRAPGVFLGGWYDIFLQGTINSFLTIHEHGGKGARGRCRLVIGPFGHGNMTELKYPANSGQGPACRNDVEWFDYVLKGKTNRATNEKPVHYYVMGDPTEKSAPGNFWRSADTWPPEATATAFYLQPDGKLVAEAKPTGDGSKSYKYDPANPVPTVGGAELGADIGPKDQRKTENRDDVLVFTTDVLTEPIEVTGRIVANLYIVSDSPDTDFTIKLTDVYPDGRSMLVTDGVLRTRFRDSFKEEKFLEPGKVYDITIDLWSTSIIFNKGHKIRVAVSSSNSPRFDPNQNTGHEFRADKETRVATNTIYFSAEHPSRIVLPIHKEELK
jgi:predicted acyl esterase